MSKVGSVGALGCAMVFAIGMLLMTSSSYALHRGHGGGYRHVHGGVHHGVHRGVYRGVHRGVYRGVNRGIYRGGVYRGVNRGIYRNNLYRHGRYYGGYRGYGYGVGGVVVNPVRYNNCRWIGAHYNSAGYYIPARRVCRNF